MFNQQAGIPLHPICIIHSCLLLFHTLSNQHSVWFVFGFSSCNCSSLLLKRKQTFTEAGLLPYMCCSMATVVQPIAFFLPVFAGFFYLVVTLFVWAALWTMTLHTQSSLFNYFACRDERKVKGHEYAQKPSFR